VTSCTLKRAKVLWSGDIHSNLGGRLWKTSNLHLRHQQVTNLFERWEKNRVNEIKADGRRKRDHQWWPSPIAGKRTKNSSSRRWHFGKQLMFQTSHNQPICGQIRPFDQIIL
jgi:hypothetical protein